MLKEKKTTTITLSLVGWWFAMDSFIVQWLKKTTTKTGIIGPITDNVGAPEVLNGPRLVVRFRPNL